MFSLKDKQRHRLNDNNELKKNTLNRNKLQEKFRKTKKVDLRWQTFCSWRVLKKEQNRCMVQCNATTENETITVSKQTENVLLLPSRRIWNVAREMFDGVIFKARLHSWLQLKYQSLSMLAILSINIVFVFNYCFCFYIFFTKT